RKLRGEIEQISYKTNSLDQGLLDRVLAAALLCEQPCASGDLRQLLMPRLERLLQMAVFRGDAYAFAPLLAYSIGLLTPSEATLRGWLSFLQSMIPRSLPYGWPSMKKVEDPNDLATSQIHAIQAVLALQRKGLMRLDTNSRWSDRDRTRFEDTLSSQYPNPGAHPLEPSDRVSNSSRAGI